MRLLYLPNEPVEGWQVGARAGLAQLRAAGTLEDLAIYSFLVPAPEVALAEILALARARRPDVVLLTKLGRFPVTDAWFAALAATPGRPLIAYYDGDLYGRVFKRIPASTAVACRHADVVLLCGHGAHAARFRALGARRVLHLPHTVSATQFDVEWTPTPTREFDVVLIGNRLRGRARVLERVPWGRMPGVFEREQLVRRLGEAFGRRFAVFGAGWDGFVGDHGPLPFDQQIAALRRSWLSVGYDHFPGTPCYFSDRLPIALLSGVAHVSHYHPGYERYFTQGEELLWGRSIGDLVDTARDAVLRGPAYLDALGARGQRFARAELLTETLFGDVVGALGALRAGRATAFPRLQPWRGP